MQFADFEIRAWRKGTDRVQLLVHRSPAGETAAPVGCATIEFEEADLDLDSDVDLNDAAIFGQLFEGQ